MAKKIQKNKKVTAKKAAPAKKVTKPAAKKATPAKKAIKGKPVAKKAAPAKKVVKAKPAAKKVAPAKKVVKAKPVVKKAAPAKKVVKAKPVAKKTAPAKKVTKPLAKKAAPAKKVTKPAAKKAAPAKKVAKPLAKKTVAKAPAKKVVAPLKPASKSVSKPSKKDQKAKTKVIAPKSVAKPTSKTIAVKPVKQEEKPKVNKTISKEIIKETKNEIKNKTSKTATTPAKEAPKTASKKDNKANLDLEESLFIPEKNVIKGDGDDELDPAAAELLLDDAAIDPIDEDDDIIEKPVKTKTKKPKKGSEEHLFSRDPEQKKKDIEAAKSISFSIPSNRLAAPPKASESLPRLEKTKFTDTELKEFKEIILKKLNEAKSDYELLKDALSHKDDNGTDDTSPTFKLLEDGSEVMSKEETTQLAIRQQKFIQSLEAALIRIENKTYGICRSTGQMIPKERLRIVPHATLSIEAKKSQN